MKINTERETDRDKPQFSDMQRIDLQNRLLSIDHQNDFATMDFAKLKQIELNTFVTNYKIFLFSLIFNKISNFFLIKRVF